MRKMKVYNGNQKLKYDIFRKRSGDGLYFLFGISDLLVTPLIFIFYNFL